MLTYKKICEYIFEIESEMGLFNKKVKGTHFWKLVRFDLVRNISQTEGIIGQPHSKGNPNIISKMIYALEVKKNQLLYGAIKRKTKGKVFIYEHPRKNKVNQKMIDIYTNELVECIENDYEIIERPYLRHHINKPSKNRSYDDYFSFIDFFRHIIIGVKLNKKEKELINEIQIEILKKVGVQIDLDKFIVNRINNFKWRKSYYDKLMNKRSPQKVYLVVSYGSESLVAACQEKKIEVVELQHGTMNRYHLGYSFPNNKDVSYFPDKIKLFGKFWYDITPIPLTRSNIEIYGYPYLKKRLEKYSTIKKENNTIVIISQGTSGNTLSSIAFNFLNLENTNKYKVIYKLHPGEFDRWKRDYPILLKANEYENFKIIDDNCIDLHEILARSTYQIGVNSTALFEGIMFECETIIIKTEGVEYMEYLIEEKYVELANDAKDVYDILQNEKKIKDLASLKEYVFND